VRAQTRAAHRAASVPCRLTVYRSNLHIYASIIAGDGGQVARLAHRPLEQELRRAGRERQGRQRRCRHSSVGKRIAEKAKAAGIEKVAFDRAGFAYHGRVKALAEAAREAGLQF
jgi:large subunit ribosomal protein L18